MIFVTGGTGFIGGHLLARLSKGQQAVRALKRKQSSTLYTQRLFTLLFAEQAEAQFKKIEWVDGDIMDIYSVEEAMEGCTQVYHCAAEVDLRDEDAEGVIKPSQKGTANMVNAALNKGVEKFCYVSSVAALGLPAEGARPGNVAGQGEITEECFDDFVFDNSPYAVGKHLGETEVWRASAEGLKVVVVSPSIVLGPWPNLHGGSMGFFSFVHKRSTYYTDGIMGYVDVNDVVNIMIQLMDKEKFGERYIVSGENINFKDFYSHIAVVLGKPLPRVRLGKFSLRAFQLMHNITSMHNKISSTMVDHATGVHMFSHKKVVDALAGYTFVPIKHTLEQTGKFYLNEIAKQH